MAAPNIVNVTTITGKNAHQFCTATKTAIVSNPAGSNKVFKINALYITNITGAVNSSISVYVTKGATTQVRITSTTTVPVNATLDVLSKSIYIEEDSTLTLQAAGSSQLEAVCSYEEIS
jgi:hypothetical protein